MNNKKPEILAPAGNLEKLKIAIHYGADAVYLGGKDFSLRAWAANFTLQEMEEGISYAHKNNVLAYINVNSFLKNKDITPLINFIKDVESLSPDAFIASDPGVISLIKKHTPNIPIHLSTQSNTTNFETCLFWEKLGISRVVLAREMPLEEILEVRRKTDMELEMFVHGAMCISYSGRCWMSKYTTGRDANQGDCAQSCRWKFHLMEEKRPNEFFLAEEDDKGTYLYNSKDLCLIEHIPELIESGINSIKIEGRMKSINYIASTVSTYRKAVDNYLLDKNNYKYETAWKDELMKVGSREYTKGFFLGPPDFSSQNYEKSSMDKGYTFLGIILESESPNIPKVHVRNKIVLGDTVEIFDKEFGNTKSIVEKIIDIETNEEKDRSQPNEIALIKFSTDVSKFNIIRRQNIRV